MLHIVLLILKIIGIVLAAVLGIIIAALSIVLFVPIKYRIDGESNSEKGKQEIEIKFSWFFRSFFGYAFYKDKKFDWNVRFFWKRFSKQEKSFPEQTEDVSGNEDETPVEKSKTQERKTEEETAQTTKKTKEKTPRLKAKKQKKKKYTFQKICDKIKSAIEKKHEIQEFFSNEAHITAWHIVKRELVRLWKTSRPKEVCAKVHFGFDDPSLTGKVLAALSILYPWYGDNVRVYPDFEQKVLEGEVHIKGKIFLFHLLIILKNLYFNDYVMPTYQELKHLLDK